jgi:hypothetical protein
MDRRSTPTGPVRLVACLMLVAVLAAGAARAIEPRAAATDDRFLAGAARVMPEVRFGLSDVELEVVDGRLVLDPSQLGTMTRAWSAIPSRVSAARR